MATLIKVKTPQTKTRPVPESMLKAAGVLKRHKKTLEAHIRRVRKEWSR